jgi:multiple sugar transport system substrate-binding protein
MVAEGKLIGPPIQVENVALMYRKDVFQKYNVKVPTTLDELEAAAKALNGKAMTDDGQPGFGIVNRGKRAAATSMFAGMLHAMGGTWLTPNREPAINSEEAIKALDMWGRLLRLYGPPGSENNHWYEASSIFSQGKAAMYTDANSLWPVIEDPQKSKVVGKVGYALFPRGPKGHSGSTVAVWGLGMPKTSKNQKAAWLFMQWATNHDQVFKVQSEKGVLGCRDSVWKDPKGKAKVPADLAESLAQGSKVGTPLWNPPVVAVAEVRDAVGAAIVTSIQGGDVRAAANKAAADMKRIMAETEKK